MSKKFIVQCGIYCCLCTCAASRSITECREPVVSIIDHWQSIDSNTKVSHFQWLHLNVCWGRQEQWWLHRFRRVCADDASQHRGGCQSTDIVAPPQASPNAPENETPEASLGAGTLPDIPLGIPGLVLRSGGLVLRSVNQRWATISFNNFVVAILPWYKFFDHNYLYPACSHLKINPHVAIELPAVLEK